MGDINKRYVIEVGANKKSLEQLKHDLSNAIKEPFNNMGKDGQIKGLSRSDKAAIKADLSDLFGIADEQAEALRKMVQGIIPSDTKSINQMKTQLQDTLKFATGIMEQMQKISDSTDWMKQGVSFVDKFTSLQGTLSSTQKVVSDIQTSVDALTKSFKAFQDALAVTNPDAFAKRFEQSAKSGAKVDANIKAIAKEMTDAAERASMKIQDVIADLEDEGIQIAVTLPDPDAVEFAAQINGFVKKASDQFKKNPIKLNVELLDPFKHEEGKKVSGLAKKKADEVREVAERNGASSESLIGLDTPDTSRIVRNILDSFQKVQQAVKEGQKNLTDETKKWRQEINNELTLRAKFDNLDVKAEAAKLMKDVQAFLDANPPLYLDIDTDALIEEIQEALKEAVFDVNIKAGKIDGNGATINLGGAPLPSGDRIEPVRNDPQATRPPQSAIPSINTTKENSEAVSEATRTQTVLKNAMEQLQRSIDANTERNKIAATSIEKNREAANKNADTIAEYGQKIVEIRDSAENIADARRVAKDKLGISEEERESALRAHAGRLKAYRDAIKNNDTEYIEKEFDWAVQYLQQERESTLASLEEVYSRADDSTKEKTVRYYQGIIKEIDALITNKSEQEDWILAVLQRAYQAERFKIDQNISGWMKTIDLQDKRIIGSNENIDYYNREIERLSKEIEIARSERGIQSRESQSKTQKRRIDNIQSVIDSNQSPVKLVFDELTKFWQKSYRTIENTKRELDDLKNGKYSDDLKDKLSKLTEDEQKTMIQGLISSKEKRIADWETRQSLMSQRGLGDWTKGAKLDDVLKSFTVESLTDILSKSSTLSGDLLKNSDLKTLSSIKEIAYYVDLAQNALGFNVKTDAEYVDEATLQAKLMELARIKAFTERVNGMFPRSNGDPDLQGIESFIEFFEKIVDAKADISTIVAQAQDKIGAIQESLIGVSESSPEYQNKQLDLNRLQSIIDSPISIVDAAKEYLESFKNFANAISNDAKFSTGEGGKALSTSQIAQVIWDSMDTTVRDSVTKAMLSSSEFAGVKELNQVSIAGVLDKMTKVFETGALKDITSEDKSYQQLIALLDRQSKFQRARTVTDLQYSGSVKSALYDARMPDKPIYVKIVGSRGEETVYDVHKPGKGRADSDRSFSTNTKGLERFFKQLGITDKVEEIVAAMFNDPVLAQTLTEQLFAGNNIQLSTKPFARTASKQYSFANTPLGQKLNKQDKLTQEIADLESGKYSQLILKSIEGLSGDDRAAKIQKIIANKKIELEQLSQLELTEAEIKQSLIALANDAEIDKAKLKDARRSKRNNSRRAKNLNEKGSTDWAYSTRQNTERAAAKAAADMVRSGTRGTSHNLENPLQQLIDRVRVAGQYGLMDTDEIEKLLAQYEEAYKTARNMPRIKDATTPISDFEKINAAWAKEEELRNQIFDLFYGSDGWYKAQSAQNQIDAILAEAERQKNEARSSAGASNDSVITKLANIEAEKVRLEAAADEYEAALQEKYIRGPLRDVAVALEQNDRAIEDKAKEIQARKDNLYNIADQDSTLKAEYQRLGELQEEELKPLHKARRQASGDEHKRIVAQIQEVQSRYAKEYAQKRQAWIDAEAKKLDEEYAAFVNSISTSTVDTANAKAVNMFNADMADNGISVNSMEELKLAIRNIIDGMYSAAAAQAEQAKASIDTSGMVSEEEINAKIKKIEEDAQTKVKKVIESVLGKTDASLIAAESYGKAAETAEGEVDRLTKQSQANEALLRALLKQFGLTKEMLNAEQGIFESREAANHEMQQQLGDIGAGSGGQGAGFLGTIDTSNLAKESTLRGIYELLNGAPPSGGWDDVQGNDVESKKTKTDSALRDFSTKSTEDKFVSSLRGLINRLSDRTTEAAAFIGASGQLGNLVQGKKNRVQANKISSTLAKQTQDVLAVLHNHPSGLSALSQGDLRAAFAKAYNKSAYSDTKSVKVSGSIANGILTSINFNGIEEEVAKQIIDYYNDLLKKLPEAFSDIFSMDGDTLVISEDAINDADAREGVSKILNATLKSAFEQFGHGNAFQQVNVDNIDAWKNSILANARQQIAESVVESGAHTAIESVQKFAFTKDSIKAQQKALQEKFKTKNSETGKTTYAVVGASKIDQALYNVGDRLTKETLTDKDLSKLTIAYSQLENAFKEEIIEHLDKGTVDFLNALRGQISSVLGANASILSAKDQQSKAITEAKEYLSKLRTESGKRVSGTSRASTGLDQIYDVLNKGKEELSNKDLTSIAQGYYRLQQTVNHAVFEKLDENTKKIINDAIKEAKAVLDKHGVTVSGDELIGTVLDETNEKLFANANKKDKKKKVGRTISSVAEPQIMRGDNILYKASVYLDGTTKQQAQEIATAERVITQEKGKQNKLAVEGAQQEQKQASATQERANAEKSATETKKKAKLTTKTTVSSGGAGGSSGNTQGGFIGILSRIATEETLSSIATLLSKGIKTTSGGGSKKADSKEKISLDVAETEAMSYIQKNYKNYTKLGDLKPTANGYSIDVFQPRIKEIEETQQLINKLEEEGKQNIDAYAKAQSRLNDLKLEQEKITLRISNVDGKIQITEQKALQNLAVGTKAAAKELQAVDAMMSRLHESGAISVGDNGGISSTNETIAKYLKSLGALQSYNGSSERELSELTLKTQNYRKEVVLLLDAMDRYTHGKKFDIFGGALDSNDSIKTILKGMLSESGQAIEKFGDLEKVTNKYGETVAYQLGYSLRISKREVQEMTAVINPLTKEITLQEGALKTVSTGWERFWSGLKGKAASIVQYIASITSIQDIIRYAREGVQYVREIDSALTELKKVTDETDASYKRFLQDMAKTGSVIGATVTDLTTMAAEWARLGYSMKEAGQLAESTAILLNVSEFDDATQASEALISTMQAFQYTADESGHVVDVLNEVGFKMPNNIVICYKKVAISVNSWRQPRPSKDLTSFNFMI